MGGSLGATGCSLIAAKAVCLWREARTLGCAVTRPLLAMFLDPEGAIFLSAPRGSVPWSPKDLGPSVLLLAGILWSLRQPGNPEACSVCSVPSMLLSRVCFHMSQSAAPALADPDVFPPLLSCVAGKLERTLLVFVLGLFPG